MEKKYGRGLLIALLVLCSTFVKGQLQLTETFTLLSEKDGIQVYAKQSDCPVEDVSYNYSYMLLQIRNTTSLIKELTFNVELYYNEGCNGCNGSDESVVHLTLQPNEIISGDCLNHQLKLSRFIENPRFERRWVFTGAKIIIL